MLNRFSSLSGGGCLFAVVLNFFFRPVDSFPPGIPGRLSPPDKGLGVGEWHLKHNGFDNDHSLTNHVIHHTDWHHKLIFLMNKSENLVARSVFRNSFVVTNIADLLL